MEESNVPITISDVPPKRQSSGLSYFYKLGERGNSGNPENSSKNSIKQKAESSQSSAKSLKQTFIEKWITVTSQHKSTIEDEEDSIPPWASTSKTLIIDNSFSYSSLPYSVHEEDEDDEKDPFNVLGPDDSPTMANKNLRSAKSLLDTEEYSIMAKDDVVAISDEELYATPRPDFSPERYSPGRYFPGRYSPERASSNITDTAKLYKSQDLPFCDQETATNNPHNDELTQPYSSEDSLRRGGEDDPTQIYNSDDSQVTEPYSAHDDDPTQPYSSQDSQDIAPHNVYDDDPTQPYSSQDSQDIAHHNVHDDDATQLYNSGNVQETIPYQPGKNAQAQIPNLDVNVAAYNSTSIPFILSPPSIPDNVSSPLADLQTEMDSIFSPTYIDSLDQPNDSEDKGVINTNSKRQLSSEDLSEPVANKKMQAQKANEQETEQKNVSSSHAPELIKLVRPEKKQIKTSIVKRPMTIENYFLFSSESNFPNEEEKDIGMDSMTPSAYKSNKEEMRKPRFGLSKKNQK